MITKNHISYLSKSDSILKKIIKDNNIPKISKSEDYILDLYKYIIFQQISTKAGNSIFNRFLKYYQKNKESVKKITRFDIFNLQYILPRWMLQIPYDILNRLNRKKLKSDNEEVVGAVKVSDYSISESTENCLDYFCIATK